MRTLLTLAVVALVATACSKPNPEAEAALTEKAAHAARHAVVDSVAKAYANVTDPAAVAALYAEGALIFSPDHPNGKAAKEALAQMAEQMKAFVNWKNTAKVTVIGDDAFGIAGAMEAKYSGPSNPMNPKSPVVKDVTVGGPWVAVIKLNAEGKITEEHIQWDNAAMMMQLEAAAKAK